LAYPPAPPTRPPPPTSFHARQPCRVTASARERHAGVPSSCETPTRARRSPLTMQPTFSAHPPSARRDRSARPRPECARNAPVATRPPQNAPQHSARIRTRGPAPPRARPDASVGRGSSLERSRAVGRPRRAHRPPPLEHRITALDTWPHPTASRSQKKRPPPFGAALSGLSDSTLSRSSSRPRPHTTTSITGRPSSRFRDLAPTATTGHQSSLPRRSSAHPQYETTRPPAPSISPWS
jgi:hypothetical protein